MPCIKNADELHFGESNEVCSNDTRVIRTAVVSVPQPAGGTGVNAAGLCPSYTLTTTCFRVLCKLLEHNE